MFWVITEGRAKWEPLKFNPLPLGQGKRLKQYCTRRETAETDIKFGAGKSGDLYCTSIKPPARRWWFFLWRFRFGDLIFLKVNSALKGYILSIVYQTVYQFVEYNDILYNFRLHLILNYAFLFFNDYDRQLVL